MYRQAAQRRKKNPRVPFNPENPYDTVLYTLQQTSQATVYNYFLGTLAASAEHIQSIDPEEDENFSDTITVDTGSVYTEYIPSISN